MFLKSRIRISRPCNCLFQALQLSILDPAIVHSSPWNGTKSWTFAFQELYSCTSKVLLSHLKSSPFQFPKSLSSKHEASFLPEKASGSPIVKHIYRLRKVLARAYILIRRRIGVRFDINQDQQKKCIFCEIFPAKVLVVQKKVVPLHPLTRNTSSEAKRKEFFERFT